MSHFGVISRGVCWGGILLRASAIFFIFVAAASAAQPAVCPGALPAYLSFGTGSCSLPNSPAVLSNFRYNISAAGGDAPDPSTGQAFVGKSSFTESIPLPYPALNRFLTFNFAYTVTVTSGSITGAQVDLVGTALYLDASPTASATMSLCVGGTFTGNTTSGCAGKVVTAGKASYSAANPNGVVGAPVSFGPTTTVDVSVTGLFIGSVSYLTSTQSFTFSATPPPPTMGITELQNNYSRLPPGVPNYGIAQGSIFIVKGNLLGPDPLVSQIGTIPLALSLNGVVVKVTVGSTTVQAIPYYVWDKQIAAILPSNTPIGDGTIEVDYNGASTTAPIHVVQSAFGILTLDQTGAGVVAAYDLNYHFVTPTNAVNPGDYISLWGTGLGPAPGDETNIMPQTDLSSLPIEVDIGSAPAKVNYHGRAQAGGLDQINVQIPAGVTGCYVPVVVKTGNFISNTGTIAVASSGHLCSDDVTGVTLSDSGIWSKANPTTASLTAGRQVLTSGTTVTTTDSATAHFIKVNGSFANLPVAPQPSTGCLVSYSATDPIPGLTNLNAGTQLDLLAPSGHIPMLLDSTSDIYSTSSSTPNFLTTGSNNTISNGSGGADVHGFSVPLTAATPLTWTNESQLPASLSTSSAVDVAWTGGQSGQYAVISGQSNPATPTEAASFVCTAPLSAGHFTIPPYILGALPASTTGGGTLSVATYTMPSGPSVSGIDRAFAWTSATNTKAITYTKP